MQTSNATGQPGRPAATAGQWGRVRSWRRAVVRLGVVVALLGVAPGASAAGAPAVATTATSSLAFACAPTPIRVGLATTCTVTVTGAIHPTGTVAFTSDSPGNFSATSCTLALIGGNQARCRVTYTPTGTQTGSHQITASYSGDPADATSQAMTTVDVPRGSTTTTLSCPQLGDPGVSITCTVTVTGSAAAPAPTGQVTFGRNQPDGSFSAPGCTLVAGSGASSTCSIDYHETSYTHHKIYANYLGDADLAPSYATADVFFFT